MENITNAKKNILSKKILELNKTLKYKYEYKINNNDILPITFMVKTIDDHIMHEMDFNSINQLYIYICGILDGFYYNK